MNEKISYTAHGKEYEIVTARTEEGIRVRAYYNGQQVGPTFSATYDHATNFNNAAQHLTGRGAAETLVECAKRELDKQVA